MKKVFLTVTTVMLCVLSQAQFRIGGKVGLNFSDQYVKNAGIKQSTKFHTELQAGFVGDLHLAGKFYLQPQLLYSRKGATHESSTGAADTKVKMNYAEVPVNLVCKMDVKPGKLFFGLGPVIGYGFGGDITQNGVTKDLFSDEIENFERYDFSANATAGIELKNGLFGSISYQHGFKDIYKTDLTKMQNRTLSISAGILLGKKR